VDRAKVFYVEQVGFTVEQDYRVDEGHRFIALTPPGWPCSIALTQGYVDSEPGSLQGVQVNVDDVDAVHASLVEHGVEVFDVQEYPWGRFCFFSPTRTATAGQCTSRPTGTLGGRLALWGLSR